MTRPIGFGWKVELGWLDFAAARHMEGMPSQEAALAVADFLQRTSAGALTPEAQRKARNVVMGIWYPSQVVTDLVDRAAKIVEVVDSDERRAIHWALATATYPFFRDVASHIGRLTEIHTIVTLDDVRSRMVSAWGDRSTVARGTRMVTGSMRTWGLLLGDGRKGYTIGQPQRLREAIAALCVLALLRTAEADAVPTDDLMRHPSLYPFSMPELDFRSVEGIRVDRLAGGLELVSEA